MTELNMETMREMISGEMPSVVDFWAGWCMPCKIFAPVVEEISDELDGKVNFGKVNVDEENALAMEHNIESIPTLVIYKSGKEVERLIGVKPREDVVEAIGRYM